MKALKKLIPAAAMLLLCAAMMTTATFAWFSMNNSVTGTISNINVTAPQNLSISDAQDGTYGVTADAITTNAKSLNPTTTTDPKIVATGWGTSRKGGTADPDINLTLDNNGMATAGTGATGIDTNWVKNKYFFNDYTFYLKNEADSGDNALSVGIDAENVSVSVTGAGSSELYKAVTFAVIVDDSVKAIFETEEIYKAENNNLSYKIGAAATPEIIPSLAVNTPKAVTIRVWIEGKNSSCINDNYTPSASYSISLKFTSQTVATV